MHMTVRPALDVRLVPRGSLLFGEFGEVRPHGADHDVSAILRERELFGEPVPRHHRVASVFASHSAPRRRARALAAARAAPTFEDSSSITLTPRNDRAISAVRSRHPSAATVIETRARTCRAESRTPREQRPISSSSSWAGMTHRSGESMPGHAAPSARPPSGRRSSTPRARSPSRRAARCGRGRARRWPLHGVAVERVVRDGWRQWHATSVPPAASAVAIRSSTPLEALTIEVVADLGEHDEVERTVRQSPRHPAARCVRAGRSRCERALDRGRETSIASRRSARATRASVSTPIEQPISGDGVVAALGQAREGEGALALLVPAARVPPGVLVPLVQLVEVLAAGLVR